MTLADGDEVLMALPYDERRARLEQLHDIELTPVVRTPEAAEPWLETEEGVVAKDTTAPYRPGDRSGMAED